MVIFARFAVLDRGRMVVEVDSSHMLPLTVGDSRRVKNFTACLSEPERTEVPHTYVSNELTNIHQVNHMLNPQS